MFFYRIIYSFAFDLSFHNCPSVERLRGTKVVLERGNALAVLGRLALPIHEHLAQGHELKEITYGLRTSTHFHMLLPHTCSLLNAIGCWKTIQVTDSVSGGVVSEPS